MYSDASYMCTSMRMRYFRPSAGSGLPPTFVAGFHVEEDVRRMPYRRLGHTDMLVSVLGYGILSYLDQNMHGSKCGIGIGL